MSSQAGVQGPARALDLRPRRGRGVGGASGRCRPGPERLLPGRRLPDGLEGSGGASPCDAAAPLP
eukprot:2177097-Pyramimonas_sp.AAC.1